MGCGQNVRRACLTARRKPTLWPKPDSVHKAACGKALEAPSRISPPDVETALGRALDKRANPQ